MPNPTPDTLSYLFLAVGATVVLTAGYIASLLLRRRNLDKDMELIEQLREDN
jgi:CcmD family protein